MTPVQGFQSRGDFEQLQNNGLVFAEHIAGSDAEQQGIADLASGAGDGYAYGCFHEQSPSFNSGELMWLKPRGPLNKVRGSGSRTARIIKDPAANRTESGGDI